MTAKNLQNDTIITTVLVDISNFPERFNLFDIDGSLFANAEYVYTISQSSGGIVETGKLLAFNTLNNDIIF